MSTKTTFRVTILASILDWGLMGYFQPKPWERHNIRFSHNYRLLYLIDSLKRC